MTRTPIRNYSLSVVALFFAALTLLITAAVLAQTSVVGRPSGQANAVLAPAGTSAPAQAERRPLTPWTEGAGLFPVGRAQTKRQGAHPMDSNPPLFLPGVTYGSGGYYASAVAVADVNGDGKPDLIVANCAPSGSSNCVQDHGVVGVLLGNGDGTFQPAITYSSGAYVATSVAVADLNGDDRLDLLVGHQDGSLDVLLGNGDGTFQPAATHPSGGTYTGSVAVADVNGDRKPDVIVANLCASNVCNGNVGVLLATAMEPSSRQ